MDREIEKILKNYSQIDILDFLKDIIKNKVYTRYVIDDLLDFLKEELKEYD